MIRTFMHRVRQSIEWCAGYGVLVMGLTCVAADEPPRIGPETEKRFPPLKVPAGFEATLFACDPLIEYPSAVALGPRPDSLFLAVDFMTGLGTEIVRRDEIRLVEDTDGDGYADKATVYAGEFNSIEGLTFHGGTVYAMHAPFLTALRDTNGDGIADERQDLLSGLGLPPEENPVRLHCANGLVMGHDGWLYLALGDHGCNVLRPEGDRLVLEGGGILRCRPNGRDLHVFSTGLRNIYDVALDDDLNVFVRDNENDGGDYKIRVCHSFFGANHGYPYLYYERPDEALPPLADLGLGSSAGGLCYRERQFPADYRGNLFFCEWGRSVVRYRLPQNGPFTPATPLAEIEFAAGAENDPYGFKPTDLVVERDGSLIVADWADGQRPNRGRGRIYRIRYVGTDANQAKQSSRKSGNDAPASEIRPTPNAKDKSLMAWITQLESESYYERVDAQEAIAERRPDGLKTLLEAIGKGSVGVRGRRHAVWILARDGSPSSFEKLFDWAHTDPDARVKSQAIRALADLVDPVLTRHLLDAGPGDIETAVRLAAVAKGKDSPVMLEFIVALGRLRWRESSRWLEVIFQNVPKPVELSPAVAHAAIQTLRRAGNWPALLKLLDLPSISPMRSFALRAIADQAVPELVDGLVERLKDEDPVRRREYADALTRVYKKPAAWVYWGYRPPPRPANTVEWERSAAIEQALDRVLADPDHMVRLAALHRMQREKVPTRLPTLDQWLRSENAEARVAAILESLREHPADKLRDLLMRVAARPDYALANRLTALRLLVSGLDDTSESRLLELAGLAEEGPVLAELLREIGRRPQLKARPLLVSKLNSSHPEVRTASVEALAELQVTEAGESARKLLEDKETSVRRAAAAAMGPLGVRSAIEPLLRLAGDGDPAIRRASLNSLRLLGERRAVPLSVAALADRQTQTAALMCIGELGAPEHAQAVIDVAQSDPSAEVLILVVRALTQWSGARELPISRRVELERATAELQGRSGMLVRWHVRGLLPEIATPAILEQLQAPAQLSVSPIERSPDWQIRFASGLDTRVNLANPAEPAARGNPGENVWLVFTDVIVPEPTPVQWLASSTGKLQVWLNGRLVYQREQARAFQPDSDRFDGVLITGSNRLVVQSTGSKEGGEFHVRFRRKSSAAELEERVQAALVRTGNVERGGKVFFDTVKAQCSKCHRIGDQGERIGPELTGIGNRFSRIHIVESILEPSRTVTPGYQTIAVTLQDGRVLTGIKVAETEAELVLGDNQGKRHTLAKAEIEEQKSLPQSTMPDDVAKQLSVDQFVDLIAFLANQKEVRGNQPTATPP